jgi:hydroxyethylthiazole kinase
MDAWSVERVLRALDAVRRQRPLVHNITNYVVMNTTANTLLALGASPIMAHAREEVEEVVAVAGALVLNIGTLSAAWIESMRAAGLAARARGVPVVLDPVGAGATKLRTRTAGQLLNEVRPTIVRGNASEILALAGAGGGGKGVDSVHGVTEARQAAVDLARSSGTVVAVTGAEDFVTDGRYAARVSNGDPWMARITGSGCAATAVTGAFAAVADPFSAAVSALVVFGLAGELAAKDCPGPGTFQVRLLDALASVSADHVRQFARVTVEVLP